MRGPACIVRAGLTRPPRPSPSLPFYTAGVLGLAALAVGAARLPDLAVLEQRAERGGEETGVGGDGRRVHAQQREGRGQAQAQAQGRGGEGSEPLLAGER